MSTSATKLAIARFDQTAAELNALFAMVREEMTRMDQGNNAFNAANRQPRAYRCVDKLIQQVADTLATLGELGISPDYDDCRARLDEALREQWEYEYRTAWEDTEETGKVEKQEYIHGSPDAAYDRQREFA